MSKPKKQHYVPQFLLRNFAVGKKQRAKLWVLDKKHASIFDASVRDIAHENLFYEYHGEAGSIEFESVLEKLDSKAADIIHGITSTARIPRSGADFIWLSYFVVAQLLRTPSVRRDLDHFREVIDSNLGKDIVYEGDTKPISEYGPEDSKFVSIQFLGDVPKLARHLQEKEWFLTQSPDSLPFIIGDTPVSKHNMLERPGRGNLGLKSRGIEIYLPISPRLSVAAICPVVAAASLLTPELANGFSDAVVDVRPIHMRKENVEFNNSLQVISAERFVYARHREHLEMPLDMLKTNPELRKGSGYRQNPDEV